MDTGYFKFVGQIVGKALLDGYMLDAHFTRAFYKHILGVTIAPSDLAAADPDYYKQLMWMKENDITNVLDLTFSAEVCTGCSVYDSAFYYVLYMVYWPC